MANLLSTQPASPNYLSPINFRFSFARSPGINYFCTRATMPSVSLSVATLSTPFKDIPLFGNKLDYGTFSLVYLVDENFDNYLEMYNWIIALGTTDTFDNYKNLVNKPIGSAESVYSDGVLTILDSQKNPRTEIKFHDMFPTLISDLWFNVDTPSIKHVTNEISFKFRMFEIKQLTYS